MNVLLRNIKFMQEREREEGGKKKKLSKWKIFCLSHLTSNQTQRQPKTLHIFTVHLTTSLSTRDFKTNKQMRRLSCYFNLTTHAHIKKKLSSRFSQFLSLSHHSHTQDVYNIIHSKFVYWIHNSKLNSSCSLHLSISLCVSICILNKSLNMFCKNISLLQCHKWLSVA